MTLSPKHASFRFILSAFFTGLFIFICVGFGRSLEQSNETLKDIERLNRLPKTVCRLTIPFRFNVTRGKGYVPVKYADLYKNFTNTTLLYPSYGNMRHKYIYRWFYTLESEFQCRRYSRKYVVSEVPSTDKYERNRRMYIALLIFSGVSLFVGVVAMIVTGRDLIKAIQNPPTHVPLVEVE